MGKVKRNLPKDETKHFRVKSNMQSWQGQKPGQYFREQENGISFFERNTLNETLENTTNRSLRPDLFPPTKSKLFRRRDDSNLQNKLTEINRLNCLEVVKVSTKVRKGIMQKNSCKKLFKILVLDYIESVRKLSNFCLKCFNPLKARKYLVSDGEIETALDKKERMKVKKTFTLAGTKIRENFLEKSIIKYKPKGENIFVAEIYGSFLILNENDEIANLYEIANFNFIKFVESEKIKIQLNSLDDVCKCQSLL